MDRVSFTFNHRVNSSLLLFMVLSTVLTSFSQSILFLTFFLSYLSHSFFSCVAKPNCQTLFPLFRSSSIFPFPFLFLSLLPSSFRPLSRSLSPYFPCCLSHISLSLVVYLLFSVLHLPPFHPLPPILLCLPAHICLHLSVCKGLGVQQCMTGLD